MCQTYDSSYSATAGIDGSRTGHSTIRYGNYSTACADNLTGDAADGRAVVTADTAVAPMVVVGGIVGLAQYASISNCTMPVVFQTSQSGYFYGGIVAAAINSSISNCVFSGATIRSSQLQIGGGIVGQLDTSSTVDGCSSSATDVSKNGTAVTTTGGIAGKSVAGTTIQNCHYTSTIGKICGDSNFTDGGGNAADL